MWQRSRWNRIEIEKASRKNISNYCSIWADIFHWNALCLCKYWDTNSSQMRWAPTWKQNNKNYTAQKNPICLCCYMRTHTEIWYFYQIFVILNIIRAQYVFGPAKCSHMIENICWIVQKCRLWKEKRTDTQTKVGPNRICVWVIWSLFGSTSKPCVFVQTLVAALPYVWLFLKSSFHWPHKIPTIE